MDLTIDMPDSNGNLSFVWPLHEPVALINTGTPVYTDICGSQGHISKLIVLSQIPKCCIDIFLEVIPLQTKFFGHAGSLEHKH